MISLEMIFSHTTFDIFALKYTFSIYTAANIILFSTNQTADSLYVSYNDIQLNKQSKRVHLSKGLSQKSPIVKRI